MLQQTTSYRPTPRCRERVVGPTSPVVGALWASPGLWADSGTTDCSVVGTGVDPVTSRFSGQIGPDFGVALSRGFAIEFLVRANLWLPRADR